MPNRRFLFCLLLCSIFLSGCEILSDVEERYEGLIRFDPFYDPDVRLTPSNPGTGEQIIVSFNIRMETAFLQNEAPAIPWEIWVDNELVESGRKSLTVWTLDMHFSSGGVDQWIGPLEAGVHQIEVLLDPDNEMTLDEYTDAYHVSLYKEADAVVEVHQIKGLIRFDPSWDTEIELYPSSPNSDQKVCVSFQIRMQTEFTQQVSPEVPWEIRMDGNLVSSGTRALTIWGSDPHFSSGAVDEWIGPCSPGLHEITVRLDPEHLLTLDEYTTPYYVSLYKDESVSVEVLP